MSAFENWCAIREVQSLPAAPADVARFVYEISDLGIDKIWPLVGEISRAHYMKGLADPTQGGPVASAINTITKIERPKSWPKTLDGDFHRLPYDLQKYVSERAAEDRRVISRALQEAAEAKKQLASLRKENGADQNVAA